MDQDDYQQLRDAYIEKFGESLPLHLLSGGIRQQSFNRHWTLENLFGMNQTVKIILSSKWHASRCENGSTYEPYELYVDPVWSTTTFRKAQSLITVWPTQVHERCATPREIAKFDI